MHTLVSKLLALSVEKCYMALMEIQLKMCRFNGSLNTLRTGLQHIRTLISA